MTQSEIGVAVGLSQSQVSQIQSWGREDSVLSIRSTGRSAQLEESQLKKLAELLNNGSKSYGFTGDFWTQKRVKYVIELEFGVIFEVKQVGRILAKMTWTRQKPQKKESKQDAAMVEAWKIERLAALKKKQ